MLAFIVLAALVTTFTLADMILYNRRQRALFYATMMSIYDDTLRSAIAAQHEGRALTEDEQGVVNREMMLMKAEQEKEERRKNWYGLKSFLLGGLSMGDE
ncbi:MAG: hypothetical protein Q9179_007987, partial [Wetmoreana sp. 5 TL-2023]